MNTDDDQVDPHHTGEGLDPGRGRPRLSITDSPTGARVIRAGVTLDAPAAAELRREAWAMLARSGHPLVVDLTAVRTAEPAAAAVLRDLAYEAGHADVDLRVVRDPAAPEVTRALLDDQTLFEICPSLEEALDGATDVSPPGDDRGHPPAPRER
ncbi:MAG TPA: STAS domain-containing protein [Actinomycetospora sp.]|uniref:STAS domain-containing protein n=1 Tax=Actinomycetospora sp. TaxID=1872135 RepID=UPI002F40DC0F